MSEVNSFLQSQDTSRPLGKFSNLVELLRIEGPIIFFKHALQRYATQFFNELYIFEFDLARASQFESDSKYLPMESPRGSSVGRAKLQPLPRFWPKEK